MKATLLVLVIALLAVGAYASDISAPAIIGPAGAGFSKPIIFAPTPAAGSADADAPLTGAAPATLKKAVITTNLYGGAIEFTKGRDNSGCPCRKQLPQKYRYDAQFKKDAPAAPAGPCGCAKPAPKPEDALPPVIAQLRPKKVKAAAPAPCAKAPAAPAPVQIAPEYYPKKAKKVAAAPCAKPVAAAPAKITPEFYPTRAERRAKKAARKAGKALKK